MQKELDVITQPIKEANWKLMSQEFEDGAKKWFKVIGVLVLAAALEYAGIFVYTTITDHNYRYVYYLDTETKEMAQTMQAMCDATGKCDKGQLLQTFSQIASEGQLFNDEDAPAPGK